YTASAVKPYLEFNRVAVNSGPDEGSPLSTEQLTRHRGGRTCGATCCSSESRLQRQTSATVVQSHSTNRGPNRTACVGSRFDLPLAHDDDAVNQHKSDPRRILCRLLVRRL